MFSTKRTLSGLVLLLALTQRVEAACTSPAGNEGDLSYNATYHVGTFCNGTNWVSMGNYSSGTIDLTSQVTGTLPTGHGGTGTSTAFTPGSVLFAGASGVYSQDNANFFWDATNHRLGLGATTPQSNLSVSGGVAIGTTYAGTNAAGSNNLIVQGTVGIGTTSPAGKLDVYASAGVGTVDLGGLNGISFLPNDTTQGGSIAIGPSALSYQYSLGSAAYGNIAIGYQTLLNASMSTSATANTAVGYQAGTGIGATGAGNSVFGYQANVTSTSGNSVFGYQASATNGGLAFGAGAFADGAVAVGIGASATYHSVAVGNGAKTATSTSYNVVVGADANTSGQEVTAIGNGINSSASYITLVGTYNEYAIGIAGNYTTAVGAHALQGTRSIPTSNQPRDQESDCLLLHLERLNLLHILMQYCTGPSGLPIAIIPPAPVPKPCPAHPI